MKPDIEVKIVQTNILSVSPAKTLFYLNFALVLVARAQEYSLASSNVRI
jgi:hypothetical protein